MQNLKAKASGTAHRVGGALDKVSDKGARFFHKRVLHDEDAGGVVTPLPLSAEEQRLADIEARLEALLQGRDCADLPSSVRAALAKPVKDACAREAYDLAETALDDFPAQVKDATAKLPKEAIGADPDALRKDPELAASANAIAAELAMADLPDFPGAADVRRLMQAHCLAMPAERAVFAGIDRLADVTALPPKAARAKLREIARTVDGVAQRGRELGVAVTAGLKAVADAKNAGTITEDEAATQNAALQSALATRANIDGHLPDAFGNLRGAELRDRIPTLLAGKDEKVEMVADARRDGIVAADGKPMNDRVKTAYKTVIEASGAKPMDRQRFYFDPLLQAQDRDTPQGKKAAREMEMATEAIVAQGQKILDAGGKFDDVRAMMEKTGIPEDWWPPRLVASLQAWRKVEEARIEAAMAKRRKETLFDREDALSCLGFVADMMSVASPFVEAFVPAPEVDGGATEEVQQAQEAAKAHGEMVRSAIGTVEAGTEGVHLSGEALVEALDEPAKEQIKEFARALKSGFGLGPLALEAMQTGDFTDLDPEQIERLSEAMDQAMGALKIALSAAKTGAGIAASAGHTVSGLVPGLGIAIAGVDLARVSKKLAGQGIKLYQTSGMKGEAYEAMGQLELEDGGAFVNSLKNEITAREIQMTRTGLEEGSDAVAGLASSISITAGGHYGAVAAGVITVVGKTIKYGSKIVFTNINWSRAQRAMALLEEARAGNPQARVQIFEDANLYAKMYICCLANEKPPNPMAVTFVVQRGITENDLSEGKSVEVLSSILLKSAGQTSEDEVSDSRLVEMTGFVGKFAVKAAEATGQAARAATERVSEVTKSDRTIPYDAKWRTSQAPSLDAAVWEQVKKEAYAKGYYDVRTGIADALGRMAEPLSAAEAALGPDMSRFFVDAKGDQAAAARKSVQKALAAMDQAAVTIRQAGPKANPDGAQDHEGMTLYLVGLSRELASRTMALETALRSSGLKDTAWKPDAATPLSPATWRDNWSEGVTLACLPPEDAGVGDALDACEAAERAIIGLGDGEKQKIRAGRVKAIDAYNALVGKVQACLTNARDVPGMTDHLNTILGEVRSNITAHDASLSGVSWQNAPKAAQTAAGWQTLWDAAVKEGFVDEKAGDGGLAEALTALEEADNKVKSITKPSRKLVEAELKFAKAVGKLYAACDAFPAAQPGVARLLTQYVAAARTRVVADSKAVSDARRARPFKPQKPSLDPSDWKKSYKAAVEAGAVPAAKDAARDVGKRLQAVEDTEHDLRKAYGTTVSLAKQKPSPVQGAFRDYPPLKQALETSFASWNEMKEGIEGHVRGKSFGGNAAMDAHLKSIRACKPQGYEMTASLLSFVPGS